MLCHHPPLFLPRHRDIQRSEHTAGSQHRWVSMTKIRPSYFFVLTFPQPPLTIFHIYSLPTTILCAAVVVFMRHWVEFAHFITAKKIGSHCEGVEWLQRLPLGRSCNWDPTIDLYSFLRHQISYLLAVMVSFMRHLVNFEHYSTTQ